MLRKGERASGVGRACSMSEPLARRPDVQRPKLHEDLLQREMIPWASHQPSSRRERSEVEERGHQLGRDGPGACSRSSSRRMAARHRHRARGPCRARSVDSRRCGSRSPTRRPCWRNESVRGSADVVDAGEGACGTDAEALQYSRPPPLVAQTADTFHSADFHHRRLKKVCFYKAEMGLRLSFMRCIARTSRLSTNHTRPIFSEGRLNSESRKRRMYWTSGGPRIRPLDVSKSKRIQKAGRWARKAGGLFRLSRKVNDSGKRWRHAPARHLRRSVSHECSTRDTGAHVTAGPN
jgi:hypothetical protein